MRTWGHWNIITNITTKTCNEKKLPINSRMMTRPEKFSCFQLQSGEKYGWGNRTQRYFISCPVTLHNSHKNKVTDWIAPTKTKVKTLQHNSNFRLAIRGKVASAAPKTNVSVITTCRQIFSKASRSKLKTAITFSTIQLKCEGQRFLQGRTATRSTEISLCMIASVKQSYRDQGAADRARSAQHRKWNNPSVYAKRSFPLSIVNTRQTPHWVTEHTSEVRGTFAEEEIRQIRQSTPSSTIGTQFGSTTIDCGKRWSIGHVSRLGPSW